MLIKIDGADQALKALRQMEPETAKLVGREVTKAGRIIARRATVPPVAMRNWRDVEAVRPYRGSRRASGGWPAYNVSKPSSRRARSAMTVTVSHTSAAGAIFEYAGIKNAQGVDPRGKGFIEQLPPLTTLSSGPPGRYIRRALALEYPNAMKQIEKAANDAAEAVNRLMP